MRRLALFIASLAVAVACAKTEQQAKSDSGMPTSMTPATEKTVSVSDFAGSWTVKSMNEKGDSVFTTYDLTATTDTTPWTIKFTNGVTVPVRIMSVSGDSLVFEAGPYSSVLRKGVQVSTHSVIRLQDGKIAGTVVAHYASGADSVQHRRLEGTKKP